MQKRFFGHIHSVIGHIMMISPQGDESTQERCSTDDFEHFMPVLGLDHVKIPRFVFTLKEDYIGVKHYARWLGHEKREVERFTNLERGLTKVIELLENPLIKADFSGDPALYFGDEKADAKTTESIARMFGHKSAEMGS
jgi:hypothetical protein